MFCTALQLVQCAKTRSPDRQRNISRFLILHPTQTVDLGHKHSRFSDKSTHVAGADDISQDLKFSKSESVICLHFDIFRSSIKSPWPEREADPCNSDW